jgi:hypothetical protein
MFIVFFVDYNIRKRCHYRSVMLINANTIVFGRTILLVPYGKHHVIRYHTWMKNKEIQELTASEPLSIDEEYRMQQTWLNDKDKCTFIILSKEIFDQTHDEIGRNYD